MLCYFVLYCILLTRSTKLNLLIQLNMRRTLFKPVHFFINENSLISVFIPQKKYKRRNIDKNVITSHGHRSLYICMPIKTHYQILCDNMIFMWFTYYWITYLSYKHFFMLLILSLTSVLVYERRGDRTLR